MKVITLNKNSLSDSGLADKRKFYFDKLFYLSPYNHFEKSLFRLAKFKQNRNIRKIILKYLMDNFLQISGTIQALIPAPSSHDINTYFLKNLANHTNIPLLMPFKKQTKKQNKIMDQNSRYLQIQNNVSIKPKQLPNLNAGNKILVFDDIWTTGATLNQLCKLLVENGFNKEDIMCLVLFVKMKQY